MTFPLADTPIRLSAMDSVLLAGDDAANFALAQRLGLDGVQVSLRRGRTDDRQGCGIRPPGIFKELNR